MRGGDGERHDPAQDLTFLRRHSFAVQARPYLWKLRNLSRETANLAVVDDGAVIIVNRVESREIMR
ncbi:hypothetical protein [Bradyrhizobium sp. WD16]|uniref:hypothetical protein n=1 Tax=Bradyrhizobium sp. WD16 TaxID=1521768 RepID=UPI0021FD6274|nr:hypothetical protein DB459_16510 [Bradyrhizobium sp. WD16]